MFLSYHTPSCVCRLMCSVVTARLGCFVKYDFSLVCASFTTEAFSVSCCAVVMGCCGMPVLSFTSSSMSWYSVGVCMGSLSSGLLPSSWNVYACASSWGGGGR